MSTPIRALALVSIASALLLSACGGDQGGESEPLDSPGQVPEAAQQASLDFAECMRKRGIDVPDPEPGSAGFTIDPESGIDPTDPHFRSAEDECRHFLEDAVADSGIDRATEIPDEAFEFAACMREQGIDFPDPKVQNGMTVIGPDDRSLDPNDPELRAAGEACEEFLPEAPAEGQ